MKKIYAFIATVIVLAAVSVAVIINAGNSDSFFEANVEALANDEEGTPVKPCYIDSDDFDDDYTMAVFCNTNTSSSMIYPCQAERWGRKGVKSSLCTR